MHKNVIVFVAFVGLNNNTILAMQNIEFGSVSSEQYTDPAENASIEVIPILTVTGWPGAPEARHGRA